MGMEPGTLDLGAELPAGTLPAVITHPQSPLIRASGASYIYDTPLPKPQKRKEKLIIIKEEALRRTTEWGIPPSSDA